MFIFKKYLMKVFLFASMAFANDQLQNSCLCPVAKMTVGVRGMMITVMAWRKQKA